MQDNKDPHVCNGKVGFHSPSLARKAAGRKPSRQVFHCLACGLFHVGNRPHSLRLADRRPRPAVQRIW